jgi:Rrf2 family protein
MFSATADYALRAVLFLARSPSEPQKADVIADGIGAPRNYLSKILNTLARDGIVTSSRGPLGGFLLAVAPSSLTLDRVIGVFDEPNRAPKCLLRDAPCNPADACTAHRRWQAITHPVRETLAATSVADLLAAPAA